MTPFQSIFLGVVQGLTEFLPISSSGHLTIAQHWLGLGNTPLIYDILLHAATLLAVIIYFRHTIITITRRQAFYIFLATLPVLITGYFLEPIFSLHLKSNLIVGLGLLASGAFLFLAHLYQSRAGSSFPSVRSAFIIGIAQAAALIPGLSRSGSTVSAGIIQGIKPQQAFRFSFLLSIPAIIGAIVFELYQHQDQYLVINSTYFLGFLSALITGLIGIKLLHLTISRSRLNYFGAYCLVVGSIVLISALNFGK